MSNAPHADPTPLPLDHDGDVGTFRWKKKAGARASLTQSTRYAGKLLEWLLVATR